MKMEISQQSGMSVLLCSLWWFINWSYSSYRRDPFQHPPLPSRSPLDPQTSLWTRATVHNVSVPPHLRSGWTIQASSLVFSTKGMEKMVCNEIPFKLECIPVGCVPSAAVAVSGGGGRACLPRGVSAWGGGVCHYLTPLNRMTDRQV